MQQEQLPSFEELVDESELRNQRLAEDKVSLGDLAAMAGQGATFGFGDELLGIGQAIGDVATTDAKLTDIYDIFRAHQKENEAKYEALAKANPKLALAMELAGGFAVPGGWIASGAKGLKNLSTAKKLLEAGKMGAKVGTIAGIGGSKANIEDMGGLAKDALLGSAGGAAIGTGLTGAGMATVAAAKKLPVLLEKLGPLGENLVRAFKASREGKGFVTPEQETRIGKQAEEASSELASKVLAPSKRVTEEIEAHYAEAGEKGAKVVPQAKSELAQYIAQLIKNIEDSGLTEVKSTINKRAYNAKKRDIEKKLADNQISQADATAALQALDANPPLKKTALSSSSELLRQQLGEDVEKAPHQLASLNAEIQRLIKGELTPQEAMNLKKRMAGEFYGSNEAGLGSKLQSKLQSLVPPKLTSTLEKAAQEAADVAVNAPGKSKALEQKFKDVRSLIPETILNKGDLTKYADVLVNKFGVGDQGLKKAETALNDIIENQIIGKLTDPASSGDEARNTIRLLQERIAEVQNKYPDLNLDFNKILENVKRASQDKTIRAKILTKHGEKDSISGLTGKLLDWTGYGGSAVLGKGTRVAEKGIKGFNRYLTTASDVTLRPIASALQNTKGISYLGDALIGALDNKSVAAKNAAIFSIMQNPKARDIIMQSDEYNQANMNLGE